MTRTPEERLSELLTNFRAREPIAEGWLSEPATRSVITAWKKIPVRLTIPLTIGGVPMHAHNRWRYVWKFRDLNAAAEPLASAAGLSAPEAAALLDRLAAGRFIYPDGSVSKSAEAAALAG